MGRPKRVAKGGIVYHVLNRANARMTIFDKDADYEAFEKVLEEAVERSGMRLLSYCVMPNHWHLVVWPEQDEQLSTFTGWLTLTGPSMPGERMSIVVALFDLSDADRDSTLLLDNWRWHREGCDPGDDCGLALK